MGSGRVSIELVFAGRSNVGKSTVFSNLFKVRVRKGRKPGTTISPNFFRFKDFLATDLPGFGYLKGFERDFNEQVKDFIVRYIEDNAERIFAGVIVVDSRSFREIVERWERRGYIPIDIEMADFMRDVGIDVVVCANKFDKVEKKEETLEFISRAMRVERRNVVPAIAKRGELSELKKVLREFLSKKKRDDLLALFK